MNTAMHIMSIQHQLVLAIAEGIELKEMLEKFLLICSTQLGASNSHIFLLQDANNNPTYQQSEAFDKQLKHYLSVPIQQHGAVWCKDNKLAKMVTEFEHSKLSFSTIASNQRQYYCFKISSFGVLVIERKEPLGETMQNALLPVLTKLATSCSAAIMHQALLVEVKTRHQIEEKIRYQASHDFLTGLCNRVEMQRRLSKGMRYCAQQDVSGCLLLIDLVHFKSINDVMGHHVGDEVLRQVAQRLKKVVSVPHTVARFGGDEFIIILLNLPNQSQQRQQRIDATIEQIIDAIELPLEVSEGTFSLSCFIGYELFQDDKKTIYDIIKNADIAMYEAIKHAGSKALAYQPKMSEQLNRRLYYTREIECALDNDEFELHYQPQFDHQHNIIGAEALLRWNHPLRGYESPAIYIPIAEESDLIVAIGDFVLKQSCADIKRLSEHGLPSSFKQISVNVSAKQLARPDFVGIVLNCIEQADIQPQQLKIEITESIMMGDVELSIGYLKELRAHGIECAIDDFGTGYSSLAYLKRLPASLLKIDRAFVTQIDKDEGNQAIANAIIELARRLKMKVIAEGVENQQELECLMSLGCFQYQGYYFSRPIPFDELVITIDKLTSK